jgi:hypothetical protein
MGRGENNNTGWAKDLKSINKGTFPFTPLESPAACSGDEDKFLLKRTRGLMPPCEPSRWKDEALLTGLTDDSMGSIVLKRFPLFH